MLLARLVLFTVGYFEDDFHLIPLHELCVVADEVVVLARFCKSGSEMLVSVKILKLSLEVLSEDSSDDFSRVSAMFFFNVKELS